VAGGGAARVDGCQRRWPVAVREPPQRYTSGSHGPVRERRQQSLDIAGRDPDDETGDRGDHTHLIPGFFFKQNAVQSITEFSKAYSGHAQQN